MKFVAGLPVLALALGVRADEWQNDDGGNTHVDIGDQKLNFGSTPPWDAFDQLKGHCTSNGCNGDKILEVDTTIVQDGESHGAKIAISAEGTFNQDPEFGNLDQMVEILKATSGASPYDVDNAAYQVGNGCVVAGPIPCDPGDTEHADQYHHTDTINIRTESPDGDTFMNVYVTVDIMDTGSGVCETITKVGGAMAGAFNGVLGGIFTLAGLGCS